MFKKKDPTEEELVEDLNRLGISTKNPNGRRPDQFSAFRQYAQERKTTKPGFAPVNPYANINNNGGGGNPYQLSEDGSSPYAQSNDASPYGSNGQANSNGQSNPYGSNAQSNPYGSKAQSSPYGSNSQASPYSSNGSNGSNPYGQSSSRTSGTTLASDSSGSKPNPYGRQSNYGSRTSESAASSARSNPYAAPSVGSTQPPTYISRQTTRASYNDNESLDLNQVPSNLPPIRSQKPINRRDFDEETLDLNAVPEDEDDLNVVIDEDLPEEQEVNSEDEEVEAIRQDIRFVKQESVASTRNTLRMAQEADASATNTMGMLGSQSSRLYNAEQNLLLAETQTGIADEKVRELQRLNRSIFIPATSMNPFNKKSRLRQQEAKIKADKAKEKYLRDTNRQGIYESEQRIKEGLTNNATNSDIHAKYRAEKDLKAAERYQFEADSEDDEMEKELASNLEQIGQYTKKLKNSAMVMGQEVDSQNQRLRKIEDDADNLDINVHLNNTRLSNIR